MHGYVLVNALDYMHAAMTENYMEKVKLSNVTIQ